MNVVDDNPVAAAVLALLNTGDPATTTNAYELDALKKLPSLPTTYTEVTVSRRFGGEIRNDAFTGTDAYRITTRACALSEVYNAYEFRRRARALLEYAGLEVGGATSTPILFETAEDIGEDEQGYWSGLTTWTLTF